MHVCTLVVLISAAAATPLPMGSQGPRQFKERTLRALLESNRTALVVPPTSLSLIWSCQTIDPLPSSLAANVNVLYDYMVCI